MNVEGDQRRFWSSNYGDTDSAFDEQNCGNIQGAEFSSHESERGQSRYREYDCGSERRESGYEHTGRGQRNFASGDGYGQTFGNRESESRRYTCSSHHFHSRYGDLGLKTALDYVTNSRIRVRKNGRTIARVPASVGIAGVLGSIFNRRLAWVGAIGLAGALSAGYRLELDVENGQTKPH
ncbi:MAG TPA: DUF4342 domain-containing protein [Bacillota bacterium]|nr:DUF4342 domain-containing protein [Bacillota bacterium]